MQLRVELECVTVAAGGPGLGCPHGGVLMTFSPRPPTRMRVRLPVFSQVPGPPSPTLL